MRKEMQRKGIIFTQERPVRAQQVGPNTTERKRRGKELRHQEIGEVLKSPIYMSTKKANAGEKLGITSIDFLSSMNDRRFTFKKSIEARLEVIGIKNCLKTLSSFILGFLCRVQGEAS